MFKIPFYKFNRNINVILYRIFTIYISIFLKKPFFLFFIFFNKIKANAGVQTPSPACGLISQIQRPTGLKGRRSPAAAHELECTRLGPRGSLFGKDARIANTKHSVVVLAK